MTANRMDYTKEALRSKVIELAKLPGTQNPSFFLDGMLEEVQSFGSFDFTCTFFITIHHLCRENVDKFWSKSHKDDISKWLKKAPILTDVFSQTWIPMTITDATKKRLLSADYDRFIVDTFKLPLSDFNNYYLNLFDEYEATNSDFGVQIIAAIDRLFDWYKDEAHKAPKAWGYDPETKKEKPIDPYTVKIPLFIKFGVDRHINANFFEMQIEVVKNIQLSRKVQKLQDKVEGQLHSIKNSEEDPSPKPTNKKGKKAGSNLSSQELRFKNIFTVTDWGKYIDALQQTDPKLLEGRKFVGNQRGHKGVVCSWIELLQNKKLIKGHISRQQLASVLNIELEGFQLGVDGRTFGRTSKEFEDNFQEQLLNISPIPAK
ncbi:MAG TPA: hypothetical protein VLB84_05515 [Bacteroidia bacterium]|nr:hypothetical protein [Bacteroidia bacterium]